MTDKELNEGLALKVGFTKIAPRDEDDSTYYGDNKGYFEQEPPDFFHDLNALDKWVFPVLRERGLREINFQYRPSGTIDCFLFAEKDFKINNTEGTGTIMPAALSSAALKFLKGE